MRLDMTKELRLMREDLRQAVTQSVQNNIVIKDAMSTQSSSVAQPASTDKTVSEAQQQKVPLFGKSTTSFQEEKKEIVAVSDLLDIELTAAAIEEVERIVDKFIGAFESKQQKEMAIKYTVMPLNQIVKMPAE